MNYKHKLRLVKCLNERKTAKSHSKTVRISVMIKKVESLSKVKNPLSQKATALKIGISPDAASKIIRKGI